MAKVIRKRRTREHIIADLSVHHIEGHILRCGWVSERMAHDYGIDLQLLTFNRNGEVEPGRIFLQLKASNRLRLRSAQRTFSFRIERRDLVHWMAQEMPVILIVYDARKDVAYWLYVQSYFRRLNGFSLFTIGQTVTVHIATANVVTTAAVRKFARFRDQVLSQISEVIHDEDAADPLR